MGISITAWWPEASAAQILPDATAVDLVQPAADTISLFDALRTRSITRSELHTVRCWSEQMAALLLDRAWHMAWPRACPRCNGAGGWYTPGTYDNPPEYDPCICTMTGKCPRCSQPLGYETEQVPDLAEAGRSWLARTVTGAACWWCGWADESDYITAGRAIVWPLQAMQAPGPAECYGECKRYA